MAIKALLGELRLESWSQFVKGAWGIKGKKHHYLKNKYKFKLCSFFQLPFLKIIILYQCERIKMKKKIWKKPSYSLTRIKRSFAFVKLICLIYKENADILFGSTSS